MYDSEEKAGEGMKVRTDVKWVAAVMLMVVLCFSVTVAAKEYGTHREAVDSINLEGKVTSMRTRENYTTFDQLPEIYMDAVLSVEDHRFYNHPGIDVIAIGRAVFNDIKVGAFVGGGSTMIQQPTKNIYLSQEKELVRKVTKVLVAFDLERNYGKNEILELYVSTIYYGNGYYYVRDTSNGYFGREPEDMTDYESVLLAGIPSTPSCYAPIVSQRLVTRRQQQVLDRLVKCGYFTKEWALETMAVGSSR